MSETVLEPPDGGYGWVIVFASVLNNFLMVALVQNVGLIFKAKFLELNMTIIQMLLTLNVHAAVGQLIGLINNALLTKFGFRKVTLAGVTFAFLGQALSSWVHNSIGFFVTFSLIASLGLGLNTSSYTLAIKSYFTTNQNRAMALSMTLTALGPILLPQIINLLIQNYHPDGVILILASIVAHGYIGAVLLQPVKKHVIKVELVEGREEDKNEKIEMNTINTDDENEALDEFMPKFGQNKQYPLFPQKDFIFNRRLAGFRRKDSVISVSYEQEAAGIMGVDSTLGGSLYSVDTGRQRAASMSTPLKRNLTKTTWWKSEDSINLDSSYDIFDEKPESEKMLKENKNFTETNKPMVNGKVKKEHLLNGKVNKDQKEPFANVLDKNIHFEEHSEYKDISMEDLSWHKRWFYQAVDVFGLDLFLDLRYVIIMFGLSVAVFAEINFTVLLPFILEEYSMTVPEIAAFLSVLGAADILFRFFAPHIGDCLKLSVRVMCMLAVGAGVAAKTITTFLPSYPTVLAIAFLLGCVKGLRVVYMFLVIPSYIPPERLAQASAVQIVSNAVMLLLGGYILGIIRTVTGSYAYCVIFMNVITLGTIFMWAIDIGYKKITTKDDKDVTDGPSMSAIEVDEIY